MYLGLERKSKRVLTLLLYNHHNLSSHATLHHGHVPQQSLHHTHSCVRSIGMDPAYSTYSECGAQLVWGQLHVVCLKFPKQKQLTWGGPLNVLSPSHHPSSNYLHNYGSHVIHLHKHHTRSWRPIKITPLKSPYGSHVTPTCTNTIPSHPARGSLLSSPFPHLSPYRSHVTPTCTNIIPCTMTPHPRRPI